MIILTTAVLVGGCGESGGGGRKKGGESEMKLEGILYLEQNRDKPGVTSWTTGEQFEVLKRGEGERLKSGDYFVGVMRRVDFTGRPIFDSTGMLTIRSVDDFSLDALTYALSEVGVGGRVKVSIPWDRKLGGEFVSPEGPIFPDETVVWELSVLRKSDKAERKMFLENAYVETASALICNICGADEPDLLTKGSWSLGDRGVLDPWNFEVKIEDTVPITLVSSVNRSADKGGIVRTRWEWVGPCTGIFVLPEILACAPEKIGEYIYGSGTGGQDWMGSYEALSLLDEDKNGWLEGNELANVSIWADINTNGKPEEGEVRHTKDLVERISVRPARVSRTDFMRRADGVVFKNGTKGSTWDWAMRGVD